MADALHVTGLPAVADPQVTVTTIGCPATVTIVSLEPVALALSVAVVVIVLEPFVA